MLDLGFLPDVERILRMLPEQRHTMLFSATMPGPIIALARAFLHQPTHIRAEEADQGSIHERTRQFVYRAHAMDKVELLTRVLQAKDRGLTMIFARTKRTVQSVADDLAERGFAAAAVHGDLGQGAREQALRAFRSGKVDVLVATDVAARGIDVDDVTHVINYQCPEDAKTYVHRIGRTGRAGQGRRRGHARRLGRDRALEAHQRRAGARHRRAGGDLLDLRPPVRRPGHPGRRDRAAAALARAPGPDCDAEYVDTEGDHRSRHRERRAGPVPREAGDTAERKPRRDRTRTRRRAGVVLAGAPAESSVGETAEDATAPTTGPTGASATEGADSEAASSPRRRRRRGGTRRRGRGGSGDPAAPDAAAS